MRKILIISLTIVMLMTSSVTVSAQEETNLLPNPSFEDDSAVFDFYVPWGASGAVSEFPRTGNNSIIITAESWTAIRIDLTETFRIYGDGTYTLSFYVQAVDLPNNMYFIMKRDGVDDDPLGWTNGVYTSADDWLKIFGTFDVDRAADYMEVLVFIVAHNQAQASNPVSEVGRDYFLDDISLTKAGYTGPVITKEATPAPTETPTPEPTAVPESSSEEISENESAAESEVSSSETGSEPADEQGSNTVLIAVISAAAVAAAAIVIILVRRKRKK
ncbi:hypothetical protein EOM86_00605 [Candidatus Nomurabacteria bacterium]|nr:hypothetical protein [Candidatus Nomurabacteria bacterium]